MKRRRLLTRCLLWGAVVLWMAVIFLFSGQNGEDSSSLSGSITAFLLRLFVPGFDSMPPADQSALAEPLQFLGAANAPTPGCTPCWESSASRRSAPIPPGRAYGCCCRCCSAPLRRFGRAAPMPLFPAGLPRLPTCSSIAAAPWRASFWPRWRFFCIGIAGKKPPSGEEPMGLPRRPYSVFPPPRGFRFFGAFFL